MVSVLEEEGPEVEGDSQEVVAAASLQEDGAVRGVVSHGDGVDHLVVRLTCVDITAFSGLRIRCSVAIGWVLESKL